MANTNLPQTNISSKIFAYIDRGYKLTDELKGEYRNSLIFIGDEGQIYSPVNDTYIGIGHTAYTNTIAYIENAYAYVIEQVGAALMDIINNSLNHNVTQFNGLEKQITLLTSDKDSNNIRINSDERKADWQNNYDAIKTTTDEGSSLRMTNGLNVTSYSVWIKSLASLENDPNKMDQYMTYLSDAFTYMSETGNKQLENMKCNPVTGEWTESEEAFTMFITENGRDSHGAQFPDSDSQSKWTWLGSYVYVDDKKTVDYVKKSLAYSITFTKYWNDKQNNSLYGAILGIDKIPVYYENLDSVNENDGYTKYEYYSEQEAIDENKRIIRTYSKTPVAIVAGDNIRNAIDTTEENGVHIIFTQEFIDATSNPTWADLCDYLLGTTYKKGIATISTDDATQFNNLVNYLWAKALTTTPSNVNGDAVQEGDLKSEQEVKKNFYVYQRNYQPDNNDSTNESPKHDRGGWKEIEIETVIDDSGEKPVTNKYVVILNDKFAGEAYTQEEADAYNREHNLISTDPDYKTTESHHPKKVRISDGQGRPITVPFSEFYTAEEIADHQGDDSKNHEAYGKTSESPYYNENSWALDGEGKIVIYLDNENANQSVRTDILDGIQTLKEVAYILDTITDGDPDGGISIAYSIAKNKIELNRLRDFAQGMIDGRGVYKDVEGETKEFHNINSFSYTNTKYITTIIDADYTKNIKDELVVADKVIDGKIYYTSADGRGAFIASHNDGDESWSLNEETNKYERPLKAQANYTQEEADTYNTEHKLVDGDEGFKTTEDIKTPAETVWTNSGDDYYNAKNISFVALHDGTKLVAGKVYYTDGKGGGRFTAIGNEVSDSVTGTTYFEKIYSGDLKFTPILQIATDKDDIFTYGDVKVLTQEEADLYNEQLTGAINLSTPLTAADVNKLSGNFEVDANPSSEGNESLLAAVKAYNASLKGAAHAGDTRANGNFLGLKRITISDTHTSLDHNSEDVVLTYLKKDGGLVDTNLLNSYTAQSYNLLVKSIQEAELNSQRYSHELVDLINYNSLFTKLSDEPTQSDWEYAARKLGLWDITTSSTEPAELYNIQGQGNTYFYWLNPKGEYIPWERYKANVEEGTATEHPGGGLWINKTKTLPLWNPDAQLNENLGPENNLLLTASQYIKKVEQHNGYVTALYGTFQVSDRHYVVLAEDNFSEFAGETFSYGTQFGYYGEYANPLTSKEAVWIANAQLEGAFPLILVDNEIDRKGYDKTPIVLNAQTADLVNQMLAAEKAEREGLDPQNVTVNKYNDGSELDFDDLNKYNKTLNGALSDELHTFIGYNNEVPTGSTFLYNTRYTGQFDGSQGNTYNYAKLIVEGDIINLSTYSYAVESVTSYGFLADALSVKSYIMNVLEWIDITPKNMNNILLNAAYRRFEGANTTNNVMGVEEINLYYLVPDGVTIGEHGWTNGTAQSGDDVYKKELLDPKDSNKIMKLANTYIFSQTGESKVVNNETVWVPSGTYILVPNAQGVTTDYQNTDIRYYYVMGKKYENTFFNDGAGNSKATYIISNNNINTKNYPDAPENIDSIETLGEENVPKNWH